MLKQIALVCPPMRVGAFKSVLAYLAESTFYSCFIVRSPCQTSLVILAYPVSLLPSNVCLSRGIWVLGTRLNFSAIPTTLPDHWLDHFFLGLLKALVNLLAHIYHWGCHVTVLMLCNHKMEAGVLATSCREHVLQFAFACFLLSHEMYPICLWREATKMASLNMIKSLS